MNVNQIYTKIRENYKIEENVPTSYEVQNIFKILNNKIHELYSRYIINWEDNNDFFVSFVYHSGTNGKENSIKNSLLEVYNMLNDIETWDNVEYVIVEDIAIDILDDVYDFAITIKIK